MHLVIDGYCSDVEKLRKADHVRDFLDVFPGEIGMNKICRPSVVEYVGPKHEDWGISGFVLIAESHIAIHTYPEHRYINIDIFSCRPFDAERAIACVVQRFGLVKERSGVLNRGLDCLGSEDSTLAVDCTTCT